MGQCNPRLEIEIPVMGQSNPRLEIEIPVMEQSNPRLEIQIPVMEQSNLQTAEILGLICFSIHFLCVTIE